MVQIDKSVLQFVSVCVSGLVGLVPRSSVSLSLGFSVMLMVSLVSRVTARSLHDNMLGRLSPSGEWS